jgi:hypothetical protein
MELREAKLKMIAAVRGGWEVAAPYLGMSVNALRNRVYGVKDQKLSDEDSLALQMLSDTKHYAEAIAAASGGIFVRLPDGGECENQDLMKKFNELYAELGDLSRDFNTAISNDDVIDSRERKILEDDARKMHQTLSELLGLMFLVYGQPSAGGKDA